MRLEKYLYVFLIYDPLDRTTVICIRLRNCLLPKELIKELRLRWSKTLRAWVKLAENQDNPDIDVEEIERKAKLYNLPVIVNNTAKKWDEVI